jgi:hypothetical protein
VTRHAGSRDGRRGSFIEFEFDEAGRAGPPRLVFLLDEATLPVALADVDRSRGAGSRERLRD